MYFMPIWLSVGSKPQLHSCTTQYIIAFPVYVLQLLICFCCVAWLFMFNQQFNPAGNLLPITKVCY